MGNGEPIARESGWSLDRRLADDSTMVGDLPLSRVLLSKDANYPWLVLVPRRGGASELIDLDDGDHAQLLGEITKTARVLKRVTRCDKLNVAALGNVVAQLHIHIIARRRDDLAWPRPVWGVAPPRAYAADALGCLVAVLRHELGIG